MNTSESERLPRWVRVLGLLILAAQVSAGFALLVLDWRGAERNVLVQVLVGGLAGLACLGAYAWRYHENAIPQAPTRVGLAVLVILTLTLSGLYLVRSRPFLTLRYDLASWSEPMFLLDIIKWKTGTRLYLPADDSNSNVYTPGATTLSYAVARALGQQDSIVFYRLLQQFFLVLAAFFAAMSTQTLRRWATPGADGQSRYLWTAFFFFSCFLFAVNPRTNPYSVFLHVDHLGVLVSMVAFWVMVKHAATHDSRWLWPMLVLPSLAFLAKQHLALWLAAYIAYLWLDGAYSRKHLLLLSAAMTGVLALTMGACLLIWGEPFRYWGFEVMAKHMVRFDWLSDALQESAWFVVLGFVGGWFLLRTREWRPMLGLWVAWLVVTLGSFYTAGATQLPRALGPASVIAGCFGLAALAMMWPQGSAREETPPQQWLRLVCCLLLCIAVFFGLGLGRPPAWQRSSDLFRYTGDIEREFDGLPPDKVLLDLGEWVYLKKNVLMKDRVLTVVTHRTPHYGIIERVRRQEYAKLLLRRWEANKILYDLGVGRGLEKEIRAHYREVRRIPEARGMRSWQYEWMTLSEIIVMEPIPRPNESAAKPPSN